jgi:hypothetical protein
MHVDTLHEVIQTSTSLMKCINCQPNICSLHAGPLQPAKFDASQANPHKKPIAPQPPRPQGNPKVVIAGAVVQIVRVDADVKLPCQLK